jgi:hypothetical protein
MNHIRKVGHTLWLNSITVNQWLERKSGILSAWASIFQIIAFPTIALTVILGYFQLKDYLQEPDLYLTFGVPQGVNFKIINRGNDVAEQVLHCFGIFDIDISLLEPLPIPCEEKPYIRANSEQGPNALMSTHGKAGRRYSGFAQISCKNCKEQRFYWLYMVHGNAAGAWYTELNKEEANTIWNFRAFQSNPDAYINYRFPEHRRIPIK